jgi:hypothetical protein
MPSEERPWASGNAIAELISVAGVAFVSMIAFIYSQVQSLQREATENTSEIKRVDQRATEEHVEAQTQVDRRFSLDHETDIANESRIAAIQTELNERARILAELHAELAAHEKIDIAQDERIADITAHQIEVRTELATLKAQVNELQKSVDGFRSVLQSRKRSELPGFAEP